MESRSAMGKGYGGGMEVDLPWDSSPRMKSDIMASRLSFREGISSASASPLRATSRAQRWSGEGRARPQRSSWWALFRCWVRVGEVAGRVSTRWDQEVKAEARKGRVVWWGWGSGGMWMR